MPQTRQLPQSDWKAYFDDFTKRFFKDANPEVAIVEVVSPDLGSQVAADHVRAHGATSKRHVERPATCDKRTSGGSNRRGIRAPTTRRARAPRGARLSRANL